MAVEMQRGCHHLRMGLLGSCILVSCISNLVLHSIVLSVAMGGLAEGKKVHIPDDLDDVVDSEEDEEWRAWGQPKPKPPPPFDPPPDMTGLTPEQIQAEMMKRTIGPTIGFAKLRIDEKREPDVVPRIAKKWTDLLKTGSIQAKIYAVDGNTLMFMISDGQDTMEVKDFVLSQQEAYEFKLGQQAFRRPGDPSLEEVMLRMREEEEANPKDEL